MSKKSEKTSEKKTLKPLNPIVRAVLCGVYEENNVWYCLGGMRYIVKKILDDVIEANNKYSFFFFLEPKIAFFVLYKK